MNEKRTEKEAEKKEDDRGLRCSRCGCRHFLVIYTRRTRKHRILRRRRCRHCGRRITTYEEEL